MYSSSRFPRPDLTRIAALAIVCAGAAGCSMPMGSLMGSSNDKPQTTGSLPMSGRATVSQAALPAPRTASLDGGSTSISQSDWGYARGALGLALTSNQSGPPVPWANPDTGTRGNFAPAAPATTASGQTCRDFVATRVENGAEVRLNGRACLTPEGQWDIAETRETKASL